MRFLIKSEYGFNHSESMFEIITGFKYISKERITK